MQIRKKLFLYATYRKLFLSYFLLLSISIGVVCTALYMFFSANSVRGVAGVSQSMLRQTSYVANIVNQQVYEVGNHLLNNPDIVTGMFNPEIDYLQEYRVVHALTDVQAGYPFLNFIGIYNGYTERYINNKGVSRQAEAELLDQASSSSETAYSSLYPRTFEDPVTGAREQVFTFVLKPGFNSYLPKKGAIVININESYIQELVQQIRSNRGDFIVIADDAGSILMQSDSESPLVNVDSESYLNRMLTSKSTSGSYTISMAHEKYLVSYVKSEELNWSFVSVNRYKDLLSNLGRLRSIVLTIALAMFLAGVAAAIWLANNMYDPLDKLLRKLNSIHAVGGYEARQKVNEYSLLGEAFQDIADQISSISPALQIAKKSHLLNYFKGSQIDLANRYLEPLKGPDFLAIVLKIDRFAVFSHIHSEQSQSLIRFAVCNIAQELTGMETIVIAADEIGILGKLDSPIFPSELQTRLQEVQRHVEKLFKITVSIGIGTIVHTDIEIRDSYEKAKEALLNRFFAGAGRIFYGEDDEEPTAGIRYPSAIEKVLVESIRASRDEIAVKEIETLAVYVSELPYDQALICLNQLVITMYRNFAIVPACKSEANGLMELATSLTLYETLEEVISELMRICIAISEAIRVNSKGRQAEIIEEIKAYIDQNYSRPDLSLDFIADQVQLTPGHLGKMFKAHSRLSFSDYLKNIRLEKAKELLLETDDSVNTISERIGIFNTTYFYTIFKKKYGVSPAQYRSEALTSRLKSKAP
ncbi:helix-turn-helix domain-containing protein [Paenibacillus jiagnxiensis]|uniref:helix-turn-helix domain-containing protein n=1 Tax=Paenibacillus jiagnxiensis TaxID=3228926 RepID=UPI0033B10308